MAVVRGALSAVAGILIAASQLSAQDVGSITGRVVDSVSGQPLVNVTVSVEGSSRRALSRADGTYLISGVPVGSYKVSARQIGRRAQQRDVTVTAGGSATADFPLAQQAAALSEIVVTGYGTQRREAVSGSVSQINADAANVGVITNAAQMLQGRVGGVHMTTNSGEPGAGAQIRVRGGTIPICPSGKPTQAMPT